MSITLKDIQEAAEYIFRNCTCKVCKEHSTELYTCERCDELFCSNCQTEYNQFSQIDYNCCKTCAEI